MSTNNLKKVKTTDWLTKNIPVSEIVSDKIVSKVISECVKNVSYVCSSMDRVADLLSYKSGVSKRKLKRWFLGYDVKWTLYEIFRLCDNNYLALKLIRDACDECEKVL